MRNTVKSYLRQLRKDRTRQHRLIALLACLSIVVAGGTTWALHMTGESQTGQTYCGHEEHQHTAECEVKTLVCGLTEGESHTHTDACYEAQSVLTCTQAEHTHGESCYDADGNLICTLDEHTHTETCYTTQQVLTCGLAEGAPHTHTDACYQTTYTCGIEVEHTHTLSCYSNPEADIETAEDWEQLAASVDKSGEFGQALLAMAKAQLGYTESTENYGTAVNESGAEYITGGYTRYGAWAGDPYGDWNAYFVSFCLNYAGISEDMVPYSTSCPEWVESLTELGFYEPVLVEALDEDGNTILVRNDYTPEQGDLIFFDWDDNGAANHVGIVEELETKEVANSDGTVSYEYIVHTIEGNRSGQVTQRQYDLEDDEILGYSSIYTAYLTAVDTGKLEGIRHLTAETEDGASFSAIGEIPENAVLEVSPLTEEQNAYLKENFGLTGSFYDIKIIQEDGAEYQPEEAVQISVSGLGYDAHYTLTGYHLTDVSAENLMDVDAEDVTVEEVDVNNTGNRIGFGADGFSIYGVGTYSASTYAETDAQPGDIIAKQLTNIEASALNGKTLAIVSSDGTYAMTSTTRNSSGSGNNGGMTSATGWGTDYVIWTFEKVEGSDDQYYIKSGDNYLRVNNSGGNVRLTTTTTTNNRTAFTVSANGDTITLSASVSSGGGPSGGTTTTYYVYLTSSTTGGTTYYFSVTSSTNSNTDRNLTLYELYTVPLSTNNFDENHSYSDEVSLFVQGTKTYYLDSDLFNIFQSGQIVSTDSSVATAKLDSETNTLTVTALSVGETTITVTGTDSSGTTYTMTLSVTVQEGAPIPDNWTTTRYYHLDPQVDTGFSVIVLDSNGDVISQSDITGTSSNVTATIYNTAPYYYLAAGYEPDSTEVDKVTWDYTVGGTTSGTVRNNAGQATIYSGEYGDYGTVMYYSPTFPSNYSTDNGRQEYMGNHRGLEFYDGDTVEISFDLTYTLNGQQVTTRYSYTFVVGDVVNECDAASNTDDQHGLDPYLELQDVIELAATSVYKYDQYGNPVSGATFSFYKANEDYTIDGDAVLTGITDANGMITFYTYVVGETKYYGSEPEGGYDLKYPMLMSEFKALFGDADEKVYLVMEETVVPEGYRRTSTIAAHLYITGSNLDAVMLCDNPYDSGVWCSPNANVMATPTIYLANEADASKISGSVNDDGTITYYTSTSGGLIETNGTLFAVVLKKNDGSADDFDTWYAVSGNDIEGYQVCNTPGLAGALSGGGDLYEFTVNDSGTNVAVIITDLPGDPTKYYTYMDNNSTVTSEVEYLVAYYWTPGDLSSATVNNTVRIASHDSTTGNTIDSGGFQIQWSTTLEVSNFVNALYFQKADSTGDLLDDAMFALYEAVADSSGTGYYVADQSGTYIILDSNGNGTATVYDTNFNATATGTYKIDTTGSWANGYVTGAGDITVTTTDGTEYTISPAENAAAGGSVSLVGYTHDTCETVKEEGTGHFQYLKKGTYFLKEIASPAGYGLNYTNIPVEVTEEAVYANAGDTENKVRVGNGVGYVARTLDVFASLNEIDETLSWVFTHLKIEQATSDFLDNADDTFYAYGDNANGIGFDGVGTANGGSTGYIPEGALTNGTDLISVSKDTTLPVEDAMVQYLRYAGDLTDGEDDNKVFDYELYQDSEGNARGVQSYRLWTESGWADLAIFQDATYANEVSTNNTNYDYLGTEEISYLFSSSTFVQVVDDVDVDLTVGKVTDDFYADATTDNTTTVYLDGAEFTLTRYVDANENIVTRDEAVDDTGAVKAGYTLQYYDPDTESWGTTEAKLTSATTFTGSDGTAYDVTTQVYAYDEGTQHHLIYTKVYTINDQTYRLESIKDGTATLKPVTVNTDSSTGKVTTEDASGDTLTGTLARSYFKIRSLSTGTYYLTETAEPTYTNTKSEAEKFVSVKETVITISDGKYYYYVQDDNKVIVSADAVQTDSDGAYVNVTNVADDGTTTTERREVYEGNNFSISIDGNDASYLVELDGSGTTAAYYEESSGAFQVGFRVNNAAPQSVGADIQLVKVDGTANGSVTLPTSPGYTEDNQYFAVGEDTDTDGVGDYDSVTSVHTVLTGAEFKLYRISEEEGENGETIQTKLYYKLNDDGTAEVTSNEAEATVLKVDENGYLKITGLKYTYVYYLVETKAPDGYNLLDHPIKIWWEYAALKIDDESAMLQDAILMPNWDDQVYIVISNSSGVELPYTGGAGTYMFTLGGIAILAVVTLVYGCGLRRRRERRAK